MAEPHEPTELDPDRLTFESAIATGGMGWVRLANQEALDRPVAVKSVRPELRSRPTFEQQLVDEARRTGLLDHPNVVPVHSLSYSRSDGPLLVMKQIRGRPWSEMLRELPQVPTPDELDPHLEILVRVCNAVSYAHSRGIVHLDVKPDNVMVGDFGETYLIDWGVARDLDESGAAGFGVFGTPTYMAPEMTVRGEPIGSHTDVYLIGGCVYELVTGSPPHPVRNLLERVERGIDAVPDVPSDVPEPLRRLCLEALDPDPVRRPASVMHEREAR